MQENTYVPTIGLEIHAELKTRTKMFCNSRNDSDETRPNVNICPICVGHPGTLPVINKEAVQHVLKVGVAVGGTIADFTEFDRKNYFYPDIPKGYQLSQYKYPLVSGGILNGVAITRVHLEEDTGTLIHADIGTQMNAGVKSSAMSENPLFHPRESASLIDFNRAGVPLMELVTEPMIRSAKEAGDFARELQLLLRYLGVSDANMEKGEMRVEANISVAKRTEMFASADGRGLDADNRRKNTQRDGVSCPRESAFMGTKVEVKNLNSFKAVERAIEYEVKRQGEIIEAGEKVIQETRGWNDATQSTFSQRRKEESHDYRYFPDPDLPKLKLCMISEFAPDVLKKILPELPAKRRERLIVEFGIKREDSELFTINRSLGNLFEETARKLKKKDEVLLAASYLSSDVMGLSRKWNVDTDRAEFAFNAEQFSELIKMVAGKEISSRGAKDILAVMFKKGGEPGRIAQELGVLQKSDAQELGNIVSEIISANPKVVSDYKSGKHSALQFLVGQGMKVTKGAANPEMLSELFAKQLK